ncbi:MAG: hypothetical protein HC927_05300 [Deltaproteobacteria bacterium]|nr:hypothetical protein [Deltaproteobacteria bacterium]
MTLFVRPRDPEAEVWSGRRLGPEGVREHYGAAHYGTINGAQNLALTGARTVAPVGAGLLVVALGGYSALLWGLAHLRRWVRRREEHRTQLDAAAGGRHLDEHVDDLPGRDGEREPVDVAHRADELGFDEPLPAGERTRRLHAARIGDRSGIELRDRTRRPLLVTARGGPKHQRTCPRSSVQSHLALLN